MTFYWECDIFCKYWPGLLTLISDSLQLSSLIFYNYNDVTIYITNTAVHFSYMTVIASCTTRMTVLHTFLMLVLLACILLQKLISIFWILNWSIFSMTNVKWTNLCVTCSRYQLTFCYLYYWICFLPGNNALKNMNMTSNVTRNLYLHDSIEFCKNTDTLESTLRVCGKMKQKADPLARFPKYIKAIVLYHSQQASVLCAVESTKLGYL